MRPYAILAALLTLSVSPSAHAGEVAGKVYDQRGAPAAGVVLALGDVQVVSGADGTYAFADVAAGEHMIATGHQQVAVTVAAEGTVRRNLFLLGRSAARVMAGETVPSPTSEPALAATFRLADAMPEDSATQVGVAWRWNDLDG